MEHVSGTLDGNTKKLNFVGNNMYTGQMVAPNLKMASATYPLTVTAVGDNGEVTEKIQSLTVDGSGIFPLRFIMAKTTGEEQGELTDSADVDLDVGDTNDFEINIPVSEYDTECTGYDCKIFIPGTEYGGIVGDVESNTSTEKVTLRGRTWRGMLAYKVVEPPAGQDHLILFGELNAAIRTLIGDRFGGLFFVPDIDTGIVIKNWQVDRYVTLYDALQKLVSNYDRRLQIQYVQPDGLEYGYVIVQAVPIKNYSGQLEYSQEEGVHVTVRDCRNGVNHLVCVGRGENQDRIVLHLYVQRDGSIGKTQYYTGLDEISAVYDYSSAEADKLEENGIKRLKELQNYKKCEMTIDDADLEIDDIIAGYDAVTDTQVIKPVVQKILKMQDGNVTIDYRVKGDE